MNSLRKILVVLAAGAAMMLPTAAGAAAAADTKSAPPAPAASSMLVRVIAQTNVNGVWVPGIYVNTKDSRVAFIPGGVGLVVVDKATALPKGSVYVDK